MLAPHDEGVLLHPLIEITLPSGGQSDPVSVANSPKKEAALGASRTWPNSTLESFTINRVDVRCKTAVGSRGPARWRKACRCPIPAAVATGLVPCEERRRNPRPKRGAGGPRGS